MKETVNTIVREFIESTLSERKMQPRPTEEFGKKLDAAIEKFELDVCLPVYVKEFENAAGRQLKDDEKSQLTQLMTTQGFSIKGRVGENPQILLVLNWPDFMSEEAIRNLAAAARKFCTEFASNRGWTINSTSKDSGKKSTQITFEGNYSTRVPDSDLPAKLYHITKIANVDKILKGGLIPKKATEKQVRTDEDRLYPPRVYALTTKKMADELERVFTAKDREKSMSQGAGYTRSYIKLEIDTKSLRKGTKWYLDVEFGPEQGAVWTYTEIPASAVSISPADVKEYEAFKAGKQKSHVVKPDKQDYDAMFNALMAQIAAGSR